MLAGSSPVLVLRMENEACCVCVCGCGRVCESICRCAYVHWVTPEKNGPIMIVMLMMMFRQRGCGYFFKGCICLCILIHDKWFSIRVCVCAEAATCGIQVSDGSGGQVSVALCCGTAALLHVSDFIVVCLPVCLSRLPVCLSVYLFSQSLSLWQLSSCLWVYHYLGLLVVLMFYPFLLFLFLYNFPSPFCNFSKFLCVY